MRTKELEDASTASEHGAWPPNGDLCADCIERLKSELLDAELRQRAHELEAAEAALRDSEERLAQHRRKLQALNAELAQAEERERRRIAADLHDHVGQSLAIARIKLVAADDADKPKFEEIREHLEEALEATRSLTFELGSPVLYELGLEAALEDLTEEIGSGDGLRVDWASDLGHDSPPLALAEGDRAIIFRAVRELMMNVVKHARARHLRLALARDARNSTEHLLRIAVTDDGVGFEPSAVAANSGGGFGLFSLRDRLAHLGGRLEIDSQPGEGTRAVIVVPLRTKVKP